MKNFRLQINDPSQLELATANARSVAFLADNLIFSFLFIALYFFVSDPKSFLTLLIILNIFPFIIYKIAFESFSGTTPGKRLMNLTVIDYEQRQPSFRHIINRHLIYLVMAAVASSYVLMFRFEFFASFMMTHFHPNAIRIIGELISKYLIYTFAFIDLISISKDPQEQNRSLHDRVGQTLVVRVK